MKFRQTLDVVLLAALTAISLSWVTFKPELVSSLFKPDDAAERSRPKSGAPDAGANRSDNGRGRTADKPSDIPARGWWDIVKRVPGQISEDRLMTEAAGVTFYVLLALFPALAALVSLYGLFADPATISDKLSAVSGTVPGGGMQIIGDQVHSLASSGRTSLGLGLVAGLATSIWSANAGMKALFDALNVAYEEHERRGFFFRTALTLAFTVGALVFVLIALGAVVVVPAAIKLVGFGETINVLLRLLRWPVLLLIISLLLAALYRYGPSRERSRWRWVSWGGGFAAITWVLGSAAFSWYVEHFGSYNKTYGSLGAAIGFMTWIWLSTLVVLIGAELNAEMEHQTARDTTTGPEKQIGARGASKADTVA